MVETCIIITTCFDNSFLLNELDYLKNDFSRIIVFELFPREKTATLKSCQNIDIVSICHVKLGFARIPRYVLKGLFCREKNLRIHWLGIRRILKSLYARGVSKSISDDIYNWLCKAAKKVDTYGVVYSYWFNEHALVACQLKKLLNAQGFNYHSVSRAHGYDLYWERSHAGYLPFQEYILAEMNGVFPCSKYGYDYLIGKYAKYASSIQIARLGTNDCGEGPRPNVGQDVFVTCCYFAPLKRMMLFAEAFCDYWKDHKSAHWYSFGDGAEYEMVRKLVDVKGASDGVTFFGRQNNEVIMKFYKDNAVTYFVNVSATEGVPVTIMEALSFGIPVLATDVGGTGELVSDNNGVLIQRANELSEDRLGKIIQQAITLPLESYLRKRVNARETWTRLCSAEVNYKQWSALLKTKA